MKRRSKTFDKQKNIIEGVPFGQKTIKIIK